jgi:hypothetical protein
LQRGHSAACFVNHNDIVLGISPVNACIPHYKLLSGRIFLEQVVSLYLAVEPRSSNHPFGPGTQKTKLILLVSVKLGGGIALSPSCPVQQVYQPAATLGKRA